MYGKRRYSRVEGSADKQDDSSIPTFLCSRCKRIQTINNPFIEVTALEKQDVFLFVKLCSSCATLLKDWVK